MLPGHCLKPEARKRLPADESILYQSHVAGKTPMPPNPTVGLRKGADV